MNKLFLKLSIFTSVVFTYFLSIGQPIQTNPKTGYGVYDPDPMYQANVWYSNNYVLLAHPANAGVKIDGIFDDPVWINLAGFNTTSNTFPTKIDRNAKFNENPAGSNNIPAASLFSGTDATFGVGWDTTYLYLAISVKSAEYLAAKSALTASGGNFEKFETAGVEFYIAANNAKRSFPKDASGNPEYPGTIFPINYDGDVDFKFQMGPLVGKTNRRVSADNFSVWSGPFNPDGPINAFIKDTDYGYNLEIAILWTSINASFINELTGFYVDPLNKPTAANGRIKGLDLSISVPTPDGQSRQARLMWNQCCEDRGWSESIHFGVITLTGTPLPLPLKDINISPNPLSISDKTPVPLIVSVEPSDALRGVIFEVFSANPLKPVAFVSENGVVSPVNNGTATVTGTTVSRNFETVGFVKSVTSVIVTVTNQPSVSAITLTDAIIVNSWGSTVLGVAVLPSDAFQGVTWSFAEPTTLASINAISGLVKATGLGNGEVLVKATSLADPSISSVGKVTISKQTKINNGILNIRNYQNVACGGKGLNNMTLTGYNLSTKMDLHAEFYDPFTCKFELVPPELMNYKLRNKVGVSVSKTVAELVTLSGTGQTSLTIKTSQKQDYRIFATYYPDPSVAITVTVAGNLFLSVSGSNCSVAGIADPDNFTPSTFCNGTSTAPATIDEAPVTLFPNPTTGDFSVSIDLNKGSIVSVTVLNTVGSVVSTSKSSVASGKSTISVGGAGLAKGLYFVTVSTSDGQSATKKLLVE